MTPHEERINKLHSVAKSSCRWPGSHVRLDDSRLFYRTGALRRPQLCAMDFTIAQIITINTAVDAGAVLTVPWVLRRAAGKEKRTSSRVVDFWGNQRRVYENINEATWQNT